jgi:hypothetical protein
MQNTNEKGHLQYMHFEVRIIAGLTTSKSTVFLLCIWRHFRSKRLFSYSKPRIYTPNPIEFIRYNHGVFTCLFLVQYGLKDRGLWPTALRLCRDGPALGNVFY